MHPKAKAHIFFFFSHLVHSNDGISVNLGTVLIRESRISAISLRLETQTLKNLQLNRRIGNSSIDAGPILGLNQTNKSLRILLELRLSNEFSKMNATRQRLQTSNIAGRRGTVVLLCLATILPSKPGTYRRQDLVDVPFLDHVVDADIVLVQDARVFQRLQDRLFEHVREEGVLVGGLVTAYSGLYALLFAEQVVQQTELAVGDLNAAGDVDSLVQWELNPFDQVEGNRVFQSTEGLEYQLAALIVWGLGVQ
jgi:hypothetical protein